MSWMTVSSMNSTRKMPRLSGRRMRAIQMIHRMAQSVMADFRLCCMCVSGVSAC